MATPQAAVTPKQIYRDVEVGGIPEPIMVGGTKVGMRYNGATFMKLRHTDKPNEMGWWIDELNEGVGGEVIFRYMNPQDMDRLGMFDDTDPVNKLLHNWVAFQEHSSVMSMTLKDGADGTMTPESKAEYEDWRAESAAIIRTRETLYTAVAELLFVYPRIVADKKDAHWPDTLWANAIPMHRLEQFFAFITSPLQRVQDYFRQAL